MPPMVLFSLTIFLTSIMALQASSVSSPKDLADSWTQFSSFLTCPVNGRPNSKSDISFQPSSNSVSFTVPPLSEGHSRSKRSAKLEDCHEALTVYGSLSSQFLGCAVNWSRPILLCEKCVVQYLLAQQAYLAYSQASDKDGMSCQDIVYGSDLIQVVNRANHSIEGLWGDSHCSYCFDHYYDKGGTVSYQFSDNLITFIKKHRNLSDCFDKNGIKMEQHLGDMANITNASVVCHECYPLYKDLSDFFLKNYTEDITHTCMDVVDVMNQTRRMWGRYFRCADRDPSMFFVWTVAIVVFAMAIVFYVGMFFNSTFEAYVIRRRESRSANVGSLFSDDFSRRNSISQGRPDL